MYDEPDEYEEARRLLAPLTGEPAGPSTVDLRRAVADGRRRLRTRRVTGVGVVAAVTGLVVAGVPVALDAAGGQGDQAPPVATAPAGNGSPSATPAPVGPVPPARCELELLPVPDGADQSLVSGGDPTGRYILGRSYSPPGPGEANLGPVRVQVLIWEDGQQVPVEMPGEDPALDDINPSGVAIGSSFASEDTMTSWVYQDGSLTELPVGYHPAEINEQGAMAGSRSGAGEDSSVPVVWRSPTADPEDLSVPGPTWTVGANDVDTDGTVIGSGWDVNEPEAPVHAFVWSPDGTRVELPLPEVDEGIVTGFAAGSIHDGVIIGQASWELDGGSSGLPFSYDLRTGAFIPLSEGIQIGVEAWNVHGWLAGNTRDDFVLLAGSELVALPYPELPADPDDRFGNRPIVRLVSDDGRTIAGQVTTEETIRAAVWRCS